MILCLSGGGLLGTASCILAFRSATVSLADTSRNVSGSGTSEFGDTMLMRIIGVGVVPLSSAAEAIT